MYVYTGSTTQSRCNPNFVTTAKEAAELKALGWTHHRKRWKGKQYKFWTAPGTRYPLEALVNHLEKDNVPVSRP